MCTSSLSSIKLHKSISPKYSNCLRKYEGQEGRKARKTDKDRQRQTDRQTESKKERKQERKQESKKARKQERKKERKTFEGIRVMFLLLKT